MLKNEQDICDARIVHYVDGNEGHHWPLLVTSVREQDGEQVVYGRVFRDADDLKVGDVPYSDELEPHTWHWRERIP